jgi:hypothetical protein
MALTDVGASAAEELLSQRSRPVLGLHEPVLLKYGNEMLEEVIVVLWHQRIHHLDAVDARPLVFGESLSDGVWRPNNHMRQRRRAKEVLERWLRRLRPRVDHREERAADAGDLEDQSEDQPLDIAPLVSAQNVRILPVRMHVEHVAI